MMTLMYWDELEEKGRASPVIPGAKTLLGEKVWRRDDGVWVYPRKIFAENYFDYNEGEHVVFGGPSKHGKTWLAFDLLKPLATPDLPAYIAVSKPTDMVTKTRGEELGFRFVKEWNKGGPKRRWKDIEWLGGTPPNGYVIWPEFGNIDSDFSSASIITAQLINDVYTASARNKKGHSAGILIMDDTMVKAKVMGLDNQLVTILAMSGGMRLGLWVFLQKPTDGGRTPLWAFENGDHFFFGKGGDENMLKRYMQIGGNGARIKTVAPSLQKYQFIYQHDDDFVIVDAAPE